MPETDSERLARLEERLSAMRERQDEHFAMSRSAFERIDKRLDSLGDQLDSRHETQTGRFVSLQTTGLAMLASGVLTFLLNHLPK